MPNLVYDRIDVIPDRMAVFRLVRWDVTNWPGESALDGERNTDPAASIASSNVMSKLLKTSGKYNRQTRFYQPLTPNTITWTQVIQQKKAILPTYPLFVDRADSLVTYLAKEPTKQQQQEQEQEQEPVLDNNASYKMVEPQPSVTQTEYQYIDKSRIPLVAALNNAFGRSIITNEEAKKIKKITLPAIKEILAAHETNGKKWSIQKVIPIQNDIVKSPTQRYVVIAKAERGFNDHMFAVIKYENLIYIKDTNIEEGQPTIKAEWKYKTKKEYQDRTKGEDKETWYQLVLQQRK
jgi:hypothetical protein